MAVRGEPPSGAARRGADVADRQLQRQSGRALGAYLRDLFTRLPLTPPSSEQFPAVLESFLPDHWLAAHPQHRWSIANRRADECIAKADA